ncbi:MAG: TipAS antibiotic-recognition domain-containing protein [Thermomicrobiales bacterium]
MLGQLAGDTAPSLDDMFDVLGEMMRMEKVNRYYTPDQLEELRARADALGEDGMRQSQQAWAELMSDVRALIDAGVEPTDPSAQAAANRWDELIAAFTGGNPGIAANLNRVWESETEIEGTEAAAVRELGAWIERARQARPD